MNITPPPGLKRTLLAAHPFVVILPERLRGTGLLIREEERIRRLCNTPWELLEEQAVVHDTNGPDVHETSVIGFPQELLRSDIRLAPTESGGHMDRSFPGKTIHRRGSIVADLETALGIKEQVLGLDIAMSNALLMQITDALAELPETALNLAHAHPALLDRGIKVTTGTILHDFAPVVRFVLDEVDGFDDISVMQRGGDAELGGELLGVLLFGLVLAALAELFDSVKLLFAPIPLVGQTNDARRTFANCNLLAHTILLQQARAARCAPRATRRSTPSARSSHGMAEAGSRPTGMSSVMVWDVIRRSVGFA